MLHKEFKTSIGKISWVRINNDINGNPRYVCHFTDLLSEDDKNNYRLNVFPIFKVNDNVEKRYSIALNKARKLGGKKYNTKNYGGGIVFQSYNLEFLEESLLKLI